MVLQALYSLSRRPVPKELLEEPPITFDVGQAMLARNTEVLFGSCPEGHRVRVMVTMPSEAADDPEIISALLAQGMDVMRINCAHDDPAVWTRLSEVQEEILWICEAAHVPVIWATQVLESLAKGGMPSRAEVTDAAMGSRADASCSTKDRTLTVRCSFSATCLGGCRPTMRSGRRRFAT